jgi:hypothetical protein
MRAKFQTKWQPETPEQGVEWIAALDREGADSVRSCLAARLGSPPRSVVSIGGVWMLTGFARDWLSYKDKRSKLAREVNFWLISTAALILVVAVWARIH